MNISQQIDQALAQQGRQVRAIGGLSRVVTARARILDTIGLQPIVLEFLTEPFLMVDGQNIRLPYCYVREGKPDQYRVSFDVFSAHLSIAVDYSPRSVAEVEAKATWCAKHGIRYCHVGDAKLDAVCDALAIVVHERREQRGLGEKVQKVVDRERVIRLGSQDKEDRGREAEKRIDALS